MIPSTSTWTSTPSPATTEAARALARSGNGGAWHRRPTLAGRDVSSHPTPDAEGGAVPDAHESAQAHHDDGRPGALRHDRRPADTTTASTPIASSTTRTSCTATSRPARAWSQGRTEAHGREVERRARRTRRISDRAGSAPESCTEPTASLPPATSTAPGLTREDYPPAHVHHAHLGHLARRHSPPVEGGSMSRGSADSTSADLL
jgi:hypothetical protein